jgi:hypothetical protein
MAWPDDCRLGGGPSPAARLHIASASDLDREQFGRLQEIYEQAFPRHLRVPLAELAEPSARDLMLVALDGSDPVGFASLRLLAGVGWVMLRYYGVAASRRRQRLGSRFWQQLRPAVVSIGWPGRIALEVEDPREVRDDAAELAIRRGRLEFWRNCGARVLPIPRYVMPAITERAEPEPMVLMAAEPQGSDRLTAADLSALVQAIFTQHYGLALSNPLVAAALASIGPAAERGASG